MKILTLKIVLFGKRQSTIFTIADSAGDSVRDCSNGALIWNNIS